MTKQSILTSSEEKQIKIAKMRMIRDNREAEIYAHNKKKENKNNQLDIKVEDIKYLGNIKFFKDINGEEKEFEFDIYKEIELDKDIPIIRYYEENGNLLSMNSDYGIIISEEYREIEEELIAQIEMLEEREGNKKEKETLGLNKEENELEKEILKKSGKYESIKNDKKQDKLEKDENKKEEDKEIPEEELKQRVTGLQEVKLNQVIDDIGTKLGDRLHLGGEYTKLTIVRTEQVRDITDIGSTTEYTILAYNSNTGNLEPIPGVEMDSASGSNPTKESIRVENNEEIEIDNHVRSRFIFQGTNTTLGVENGEYGEIEVYLGSKAEKSNEYFETQLETSQIWPNPKIVRELQNDKNGKYRTDEKIEEVKKHEGHGHKVDKIQYVDGKQNSEEEKCEEEIKEENEIIIVYTKEDVEILSKKLHCSEQEATRLLDEYMKDNPNIDKITKADIESIEEEQNEIFREHNNR